MGRELKICRPHTSRKGEWVPLEDKPNGNAPSVGEIVEELREARKNIIGWVDDGRGWDASDFEEVTRIDNLIERLK